MAQHALQSRTAPGETKPDRGAGDIFGHPRGLFMLFFVEMWERFSYYGMRALLVLYLVDHFGFTDPKAYMIYGAYTALVYVTPVLGGAVADRYLGAREAVLLGATLLTLGHLLLAFEGDGGREGATLQFFYLALAFIIMGVGFLKANVSVLVGQLYKDADPRRDAGFTLFYMGINLGGGLGPIATALLGYAWGWAWGFGAAGVAMALGLLVFVLGKPTLEGHGEPRSPERLDERHCGISTKWWIRLATLAGVALCWLMVQHRDAVGWLLGLAGGLLLISILFFACAKFERRDRERTFAALFLILVSVFFWSLAEQAGSSLNLFTDRYVAREIFGFEVPAATFQSLASLYIVFLAPPFAWLWTALARRGREPCAPVKFALGLLLLAAGFLTLSLGTFSAGGALVPVGFIFLLYFLQTAGEMCLSPVGLSAMTRLALPQIAGLVMGAWFFANAAGNFIASLIAQASGQGNLPRALGVASVYETVGLMAAGAGVCVLLVSPLVTRLMHVPPASRQSGPSRQAKSKRDGE